MVKFYISSISLDPKAFLNALREHFSVEKSSVLAARYVNELRYMLYEIQQKTLQQFDVQA